jgi:hypothetical protein
MMSFVSIMDKNFREGGIKKRDFLEGSSMIIISWKAF